MREYEIISRVIKMPEMQTFAIEEFLPAALDYSVIIPLRNEAGNVKRLVESLIPVMDSLSER